MKDLIERGYLYIAQPPLFKVKRGKSERYIKDEAALHEYLLDQALGSVQVFAAGSDRALSEASVRALLAHAREFGEVMLRLALRPELDQEVIGAAVTGPGLRASDLADGAALRERVAPGIDARLAEIAPDAPPVAWTVEPDTEHGGFRLLGERRVHGIPLRVAFDADFIRSPELQHLAAVAERMAEVGAAPFRVLREGAEPETAAGGPALHARVLEIAQKGLLIQRYKGLGEMNPEQLAETTMNPDRRTLLQVKVEDEYEADDAVSRLMGEEVEPRREFIERHALDVRNLDV
jgi:DNA gyrase subunit B